MPQLFLKGSVWGCLGSWWNISACCWPGPAEDLLAKLMNILCYVKTYCYVTLLFTKYFALDQKLRASFAFIFNQFPFPALCFLLYCLPSALLEWFLNICTEIKTSGTVSRTLPCKENLDIVINVGWITSLYFNFESTLWCSPCHRICICWNNAAFFMASGFYCSTLCMSFTESLIILVPEHNWGLMH